QSEARQHDACREFASLGSAGDGRRMEGSLPNGAARSKKAQGIMTTGHLDLADHNSVVRFITENTKLISPPLVPEMLLHLAAESLPIWQKTEDELGEINLPPPYWAFAWAGGQAVARYLIDHPEICRGQSVLDLGSGSGISAIAAAKTGAHAVLAADIDRLALAACALNARANAVDLRITGADLIAELPRGEDIV